MSEVDVMSGVVSNMASVLWEFLTLQRYVTPVVVLVIYYAGAIALPLMVGAGLSAARRGAYAHQGMIGSVLDGIVELHERAPWRAKLAVVVGIVVVELLWRMCAEVVAVYFQIGSAMIALGGSR